MTLVVVLALIWQFAGVLQTNGPRIPFSEFLTKVDRKEVQEVTFKGYEIRGKYVGLVTTDGNANNFTTHMPPAYEGLPNRLMQMGVLISAEPETTSPWTGFLLTWAPILLMVAFWIFMMRQMQSGGNKALSFGKSRAKLSSSAQKKVTFRDVAGADEAKEELQEIIEFLREPQKFQKLGGRIPKGVLLMGSPGTGKTLLARPVPGEPKWR
jgi:cell division protease FtsH